jgi:hypothetical protein
MLGAVRAELGATSSSGSQLERSPAAARRLAAETSPDSAAAGTCRGSSKLSFSPHAFFLHGGTDRLAEASLVDWIRRSIEILATLTRRLLLDHLAAPRGGYPTG